MLVVMLAAPNAEAQKRASKKRTTSVSRTKKTPTSKRKRKRRQRRPRPRNTRITRLVVQQERQLADGVRYVTYRSNGSQPLVIHAVSMDRTVLSSALRLVKGEDRVDGLERLREMAARVEAQTGAQVIALANANFWTAYRNTPIGPCVVDGDVVHMHPYKQWSSAFFDMQGAMTIDTFRLSATVRNRVHQWTISATNQRSDSTEIVLYNRFAGDSVPQVRASELARAYAEAAKDTVYRTMDSTEAALSLDELRREIAAAQREASAEYRMTKILLRYTRSPAVNADVPCEVLEVTSGTRAVPSKGCILSLPADSIVARQINVGDTMTIRFMTNIKPTTRFMNAVSGTPRLVRNGVAKHEAMREGSTGRRFITHNLPRTAIGMDRTGNRVLIVTVEFSRPEIRTIGATLTQLADVMRLLGAYNAMNLDGGGSTGLVIDGDHVFYEGEDPQTRRISVGIGFVKRPPLIPGTTSGSD
jgi:hypothetical protein